MSTNIGLPTKHTQSNSVPLSLPVYYRQSTKEKTVIELDKKKKLAKDGETTGETPQLSEEELVEIEEEVFSLYEFPTGISDF